MDPFSIAMLGAKAIGGAAQLFAGRKILKNSKMPDYNIASEFDSNVGLAKGVKNMGGMPSQQYNNAMIDINRVANFGIGQLQKRNAGIAGVGSITQRAMDGARRVNEADATMALQNFRIGTQMQMGANAALGAQKMQKQQWEKFNPYLRKLNEGQSLMGAGLQNIFGAASSGATMNMYDNVNNDGFSEMNPMQKLRMDKRAASFKKRNPNP